MRERCKSVAPPVMGRAALMGGNPCNIHQDIKEDIMTTEYTYGTLCTLLKAYDADAGRTARKP